jgi:hypothetical protein
MRNEPVITGFAGLNALVVAAISLAEAFGWIDWTDGQIATVIAFVGAVSVFAAGFIRKNVMPLPKVEAEKFEAYDKGLGEGFQIGLYEPVPDDAPSP